MEDLPEAEVILIHYPGKNFNKLILTKGQKNAEETMEEFVERVNKTMGGLFLKEYTAYNTYVGDDKHC